MHLVESLTSNQPESRQTSHRLRIDTYQGRLAKNLLTSLGEVNGSNTNFPTLIAPVHLGAQSPSHDLVSKADSNDPHAILSQDALNEIHKLQDPRIIVEGIVLGTGDQDAVDIGEVRVGLCGYHIEDGELETGSGRETRVFEAVGSRIEEGGENTTVATVLGTGAFKWRIALEDGNAEGWLRHTDKEIAKNIWIQKDRRRILKRREVSKKREERGSVVYR
jgi:hypothetical protein